MTKRTTTESELREWIAQGKSHGEIAGLIGRRREQVATVCMVLGISSVRGCGRPAIDPKRLESYVTGLRAGMTIREIATTQGVSHSTVHQALRRHGLPTSSRQLLRREAAAQVAEAA